MLLGRDKSKKLYVAHDKSTQSQISSGSGWVRIKKKCIEAHHFSILFKESI
jgi:hypothetical protein